MAWRCFGVGLDYCIMGVLWMAHRCFCGCGRKGGYDEMGLGEGMCTPKSRLARVVHEWTAPVDSLIQDMTTTRW
ncbi:hypothetical protein QBC47DRAFT_388540 [Echria macrotheca]|uniref:Secreted protein n=1 Tax=Echria macrotheca TaxID=438768 RepID=A0AAJ0B753_9PEZI|nr:hypothetical protein QBC47DRAFT_388540 [Echria macrotheca]